MLDIFVAGQKLCLCFRQGVASRMLFLQTLRIRFFDRQCLFFLEMELFRHETVKRKWKIFTTKTMHDIIDCNYCSKTSCINDYEYSVKYSPQ